MENKITSDPPDPKTMPISHPPRTIGQKDIAQTIQQSPEIPNKKARYEGVSWRPNTSQSMQQSPQSSTQKPANIDLRPSSSSSSSSYSLDKCVKKMIKNELNKTLEKNEKNGEEEMMHKIESIKNDFQKFQKSINEKIAAVSIRKKEIPIHPTFEIPPWFEERIKGLEKSITGITAQVQKISETLSKPENIIEERIAAVVEEKLEQRKETSSISRDPKWLIPQNKCQELYNYSQGQVAKFLADYLPILYDLPGIIAPYKSDEKGEEARAVIDYFWKGTLTTDLCIKEIEKEHANQRYKISRKIYQGLKNSAGCIMSKTGSIYECNWDEDRRKFIPKIGEFEILRPQEGDDDNLKIKKVEFEWAIPKDIYKEKFVKNDYMIFAKNDDLNQTRISKVDLDTLEINMLYTKRKYGNN